MGKNAHLHIVLDSEFLEKLKEQAREKMISLSELCRLKLQNNLQLDKIEYMIEKLLNKNERIKDK